MAVPLPLKRYAACPGVRSCRFRSPNRHAVAEAEVGLATTMTGGEDPTQLTAVESYFEGKALKKLKLLHHSRASASISQASRDVRAARPCFPYPLST